MHIVMHYNKKSRILNNTDNHTHNRQDNTDTIQVVLPSKYIQ